MAAEAPDWTELSAYLKALAVPNRLQLLHKLQLPHALHEIALPAVRPRGALRPARPLSRQTVQAHLATLQRLGLVTARDARQGARVTPRYTVNHARLFLVVEELRRLSLLRAAEAPGEATVEGPGAARIATLPEGPALVLAGGPLEGAAFALAGPGPWTVGRDRANDVALPYDPFASQRNARLWRDPAGALRVEDLAGSRNGTRVNWRPLGPGEQPALEAGDTLGVGRSLLIVRRP